MPETNLTDPSSAIETLLVPLYLRALETQCPDALLKDERAVALVQQIDYDFSRIERDRISEETRVALILRNRQFDRITVGFLARFPQAVAVHIGCGLDARFERVDNGEVEWYDQDLPEVIDLRRELLGGEGERYHLLACSALDSEWLEVVDVHSERPFLFLSEGMFMFLQEAQVKSLVLTLKERFPGAELVFDAFSPFFVWANNRRFERSGIGARCHWGLKRAADLESWGDGIHLLEEWYPFRESEPRLGQARWWRSISFLAKTMGVFRYRLGEP